jgi:hypothetical protein
MNIMGKIEIEKRYILARNLLAVLDIFLALLITFTARYLTDTPFGKAALTFGLIMIAITTVLKISHNWIFTKDYPLKLRRT